jgi:CHAD domain-containing protein
MKKPYRNQKEDRSILPEHFRIDDFVLSTEIGYRSKHYYFKNFSDDHIHSIRKNLKDIFYNAHLYTASSGKNHLRKIWRNKGSEYFDKLLDELGCFQDKCTAISLIKPYWLIDFDEASQQFLYETKKLWIKEKRRLKRQLVVALTMDLVE